MYPRHRQRKKLPPMKQPPADRRWLRRRRHPTREVLHGYVAKKQFYKEYERISGLGVFLALGSVAPVAFSSGLALALISILAIAMILVCLAFPLYTLYVLYGAKGSSDARALLLKKTLRLGWIPPDDVRRDYFSVVFQRATTARRLGSCTGVSAMVLILESCSIRCPGDW